MSISDSKGLLTGATRQLQEHWQEALSSWRDRKAEEFEKLYLADLAAGVNSAVKAIEELERLLHKVHADCD